jgi:uncharacterized Zn finger protein
MYITCDKCGETNHLSLWARISGIIFKCPKCGHTQSLESFEKEVS